MVLMTPWYHTVVYSQHACRVSRGWGSLRELCCRLQQDCLVFMGLYRPRRLRSLRNLKFVLGRSLADICFQRWDQRCGCLRSLLAGKVRSRRGLTLNPFYLSGVLGSAVYDLEVPEGVVGRVDGHRVVLGQWGALQSLELTSYELDIRRCCVLVGNSLVHHRLLAFPQDTLEVVPSVDAAWLDPGVIRELLTVRIDLSILKTFTIVVAVVLLLNLFLLVVIILPLKLWRHCRATFNQVLNQFKSLAEWFLSIFL